MKLFLTENNIDPDFLDIYYYWGKKKMLFATVPYESFNLDILDDIAKIIDFRDVELEVKVI